MYKLGLYEMIYEIKGKTYSILILSTSFNWAITHPNWEDMEGVTNAQCYLVQEYSIELNHQHSISISTLFEVDKIADMLIKKDKKEN